MSEEPREDFTPVADWRQSIRFHLPVFEGPLDLLLHLIKRNELSPQEVAASVITEQYMRYLALMEELDLEVASEYLVMAATLLLIKSASLLPQREGAAAEVEDAEEIKENLIDRLVEYERFRRAAEHLAELPLLGRDSFAPPGQAVEGVETASPYLKVSVWDLLDALDKVIKRLAQRLPKTIPTTVISVASRVPVILESIARFGRVEFFALFDGEVSRPLIVATFLALLELIRRGEVIAFQEEPLGSIWFERREN